MLKLRTQSNSGNPVGGNGDDQDPNKKPTLGATGHQVNGAGKSKPKKGSKLKPLAKPAAYTNDKEADAASQRPWSLQQVVPPALFNLPAFPVPMTLEFIESLQRMRAPNTTIQTAFAQYLAEQNPQ